VKRAAVALLAGLLFGFGLQWAGMTDPVKVQAFLDVTGPWDPSLALVMAGAAGTTLLLFPLIRRRGRPWWDVRFHLAERWEVDARLLSGAALFGLGWGVAGYCPGPALAGLALGNPELWWFLPAYAVGTWWGRPKTKGSGNAGLTSPGRRTPRH
jgi:uncharacterized membrane protein YedE/YeeE